MIKNRKTFFIGIFVFIIPFLGFPSSWKTFFTIIAGLSLMVVSIKINLPKKTSLKRPRRKEKVTQVFVESSPALKVEDILSQKENKEKTEENLE